MGVNCKPVLAFGIELFESDIKSALEKLGVKYDHDEPHYELASRYDLICTEVGSYYSGHVMLMGLPR